MTAAYTETLEWLQYMVQLNPESKSSVASIKLHTLNRFMMMDNIKHTCCDNVFNYWVYFILVYVPTSVKIDELIRVLYGINTVFVCLIQIVGDPLLILYN